MGKYILVALVFLTGCSHKIIGKNCLKAETSEFHVCDTLNLLGK
jgi:hypothetical protein